MDGDLEVEGVGGFSRDEDEDPLDSRDEADSDRPFSLAEHVEEEREELVDSSNSTVFLRSLSRD